MAIPQNKLTQKAKDLPDRPARLAIFLNECLTLGTLRGFKHFRAFVRAREELILCVYNKQVKSDKSATSIQNPAILLPKSLMTFSNYEDRNQVQEVQPDTHNPDPGKESDEVIFLIAGYLKYRCPYVWLQSHQEELLKKTSGTDSHYHKNNPLQLETTQKWKTKDVSLWEVVEEIIRMTARHTNPFEIDVNFLDKLPLQEAILLSEALLKFLENIYMDTTPLQEELMDSVWSDMTKLRSKNADLLFAYGNTSLLHANSQNV